jgi:phosphoribosylformylglycinamidine cyclo-ligase
MSTYKDSGVDVSAGDLSSSIAYKYAKTTFDSRSGLFGTPVILDGGYAGLIDLGEFYLVQNDDGIGTKSMVAESVGTYETLGYDLLCMVADDAVCLGAEVISITNTIDTNKVKPEIIEQMMKGLAEACIEQKILIPGGEIGELPDLANGITWNAAAVGVLEKSKLITGSDIKAGDSLIALPSHNFRSNGLSLARFILNKHFGKKWPNVPFDQNRTWGELVLRPSIIYHNSLLNIIGRYKHERKFEIKGISHITGGGIVGNLPRILKKSGLGANVEYDYSHVPESMRALIELDQLDINEAIHTWNMGIAMILVTDKPDELKKHLSEQKCEFFDCGKIVENPEVTVKINN